MQSQSELPDDITVGPFLAVPPATAPVPERRDKDEIASEVLTAVLFLGGILALIATISEIAR